MFCWALLALLLALLLDAAAAEPLELGVSKF